ncbi:RluA family pseudouridine synthase [bacterium]|nr:RluA family pseudouridine synthase [bacterium]
MQPNKLKPNIALKKRINVLYEDKSIIVIDKSTGILSQPAKNSNDQSVIELLKYYRKAQKQKFTYLGIVHRIDKETSGLMVIAKTKIAHRILQQQFTCHKVAKRYIAVTKGIPWKNRSMLSGYITRNNSGKRTVEKTGRKGKEALTRYKVIESFKEHAVVELAPETGKSHQIRLQLAHICCPVMGEFLYGNSKNRVGGFSRCALHAAKLSFLHPETAKRQAFESPIPQDIQNLIEKLRSKKDK